MSRIADKLINKALGSSNDGRRIVREAQSGKDSEDALGFGIALNPVLKAIGVDLPSSKDPDEWTDEESDLYYNTIPEALVNSGWFVFAELDIHSESVPGYSLAIDLDDVASKLGKPPKEVHKKLAAMGDKDMAKFLANAYKKGK